MKNSTVNSTQLKLGLRLGPLSHWYPFCHFCISSNVSNFDLNFFNNIHWCCVNVLDFFSEFFEHFKMCYRVWSTGSTLGVGVPDISPLPSHQTNLYIPTETTNKIRSKYVITDTWVNSIVLKDTELLTFLECHPHKLQSRISCLQFY